MNVIHRKILLLSLKLGDLALATLAFGLASYLMVLASDEQSFSGFLSMRIKLGNFLVFGMTLLGWHLIYSICGLYESRRLCSAREVMAEELKASGYAAASLLIIAVAFKIRMISAPFVILYWSINSLALLTSRALLRHSLRSVRRRGHNLRNTLVLGTNRRALDFASRLRAKPEWGYRNLGFVDESWPGLAAFSRTGNKLVTNINGLADFLRNNVVDEVAIYLPLRSCHAQATAVATLCGQHGITVRYDTDIFGVNRVSAPNVEFDSDPYFVYSPRQHDGWAWVFKRLLDICGSLALLVFLLPILTIAALLVKLTSPGPVFFQQERIGINKRRFRIWKFRTMVTDAESLIQQLEAKNEVSGPVFKIKNDPRITRVGRWLRRASIDELPQLVNVLSGEMSLVGPRPLPVRDFEGFSEDWQRRRFSVRPGITCLWQIQGRSSIAFERWMELDLQYLDEWSLWLDLKILALTIPAVFKGSGAA